MTMVIAYVWKDKIVMMADSRISKQNDVGEVVEHSDDSIKIIPLNRRGIIGHSGARKLPTKEGYFDLIRITQHFVSDNQNIAHSCTAEETLERLVSVWKDTLGNSGCQSDDVDFCLLLGKWEERSGYMYPMLYSYSSQNNRLTPNGTKGCIGDPEIIAIIEPYFNKDLDGMSFEETINYFKQGFSEVISSVETVGGFIHVYVLAAREIESHWRDYKFFKTNN
ncbi:hypothetical protein H0911_06905 [Bacillus sp. HSTU-bmb18]|uniref:hypothetical protein n=1 Tax=Bacillus sp. HSTU-bmb18 TaxID=2755318 RepID=UPI0034C67C4D|nr:hypothetical protein [Bacillus cereus]